MAVKILGHFDGLNNQTSYTFSTGQVATFSGSTRLDTGDVKFGSAALRNYRNSAITILARDELDFGQGDFTFDMWVFLHSSSGIHDLISYQGVDQSWGSPDGVALVIVANYDSSKIEFYIGNGSIYYGVLMDVVSSGVWHHIALVRNGNNLFAFIDGVKSSVTDVTGVSFLKPTTISAPLYIGQYPFIGSRAAEASIDELRICNHAAWVSNFTPPTSPYSMGLSYFSQASVGDGTAVLSTVDRDFIVSSIQSLFADSYFDSASKIAKVNVYYTHQDGVQKKRIIHDGTALTGSVMWSHNALDGTWAKDRVVAFDANGAQRALHRAEIGTFEDCTHSEGITYLNV